MKTILLSLILNLTVTVCVAVNGITSITNTLTTNQRTNRIVITDGGAIYTGLSEGLMKYENGIWTKFDTANSAINSNNIYQLYKSNNGEVIIVNNIGISIFNGNTFIDYSYASLGLTPQINVVEKVQNNLWVGTNSGLYKYDGSTLTSYNVSNNMLFNDSVTQIKYWNNEIWVATKGGLTKINSSNTSYTYLKSNSALKQNYIYDIATFQNKLYIVYKADLADFLNVQFFDGTIFSQLNDVGMKTKIDSYNKFYRIKATPEGLILQDSYNGAFIYFNITKREIYSTGNLFAGLIYFEWHALSNSLALVWRAINVPMKLLNFNDFNCLECDGLPVNNKYIDINNVKAIMNNRGILNYRGPVNNSAPENPDYEFPKGSGSPSFLPNSLWLGNLDNNNNLHLAAQTYRQSGEDFWPGPINTSTGNTDTVTALAFDKVWKINRFDVEEFKWAFNLGYVQNGTYVVPEDIVDWPANGNSSVTQSLAPFFDKNSDGLYKPLQDGDFPIIRGDQMLYWIFNDKLSSHTESGGQNLGVEVHASVYAYQCNTFPANLQVINNTIFCNFEIINRSSNNYDNFIIGNFCDPDMQYLYDDYVASYPSLNLTYTYSKPESASVDPSYKGLKIGNTILNGPFAKPNDGIDNNNNGQIDEPNEKCLLSHAMIFKNDQSTMGNPSQPNHYYQYMQTLWKDNSPLTYGGNGYGGSAPTKFFFDGQPWDTTTWNCNEIADWRMVQTSGPVIFNAGDTINYEYAIVNYANPSMPWDNAAVFQDFYSDVQTIRNSYYQNNITSCLQLDLGMNNKQLTSEIKLFPNPAQHYFELQSNNEMINQVVIFDINGSLINQYQINNQHAQIDIQDLSQGIYFIQANSKSKSTYFKLIKQ